MLSTKRTLIRLAWLAALLSAPLALADAVELTVRSFALLGKELPSLSIHVREPIAGFEVKLRRGDGKETVVRGGGRPGTTRVIDLPQPEGKFSYKGELTVNFPNGSSSAMPLEFEAELAGKLKITSEDKDLDLENRKLTLRFSRPAAKAEVKVLMDTGRYALDGEVIFHGEPAGTPLEVSWPEAPGKVMKIDIVGHDAMGVYQNYWIYPPWHVDVPHEEVSFDTGKWEIRPAENKKLDKAYQQINEVISKYGRFAQMKLYIAGHTDTVAGSAFNRTLSLNRARAIGQYFRKRGLNIPTYFEGFGEEAPAVVTPDETDEPRNRRAQYLLTIERPALENPPFPPRWQKL